MTLLPNLHETPFTQIGFRLEVPFELVDAESIQQLHESMFADEGPRFFKTRIDGGDSTFEAYFEYDLEWDLESCLQCSLLLTMDSISPPPHWPLASEEVCWQEIQPDEMEKRINIFLDHQTEVSTTAKFRLPLEQIAPSGLIHSMIGLKASAGEDEFLMSGAQFSVRGFPGDTISWFVTSGTNGQEVLGTVTSYQQSLFQESSLRDMAFRVQGRFKRFVYYNSEAAAYAS